MIRVKNISKSFDGKPILEGISYEVPSGFRCCVLGASGSGKSVLMRLMLALEQPDGGELWVDGQDTTRFSWRDWQMLMEKVGVVFQSPALLDSLTIAENIGIKLFEEKKLNPTQIREEIKAVLRSVLLDESVIKQYPPELSGGMQKRVGIARVLIHKPSYLFYDEPTSGLDPVSAAAINQLILKLGKENKRTSIIITHDLQSLALLAEQVVMLHGRKIIFDGSLGAFYQSDNPVVRRYLDC